MRETYVELERRCRERGALLARRELAVSVARLVTMAALLLILWMSVQSQLLPLWAVLLPVAGFLVLLPMHERLLRRRDRARRAALFYREGIARLDGTWAGGGRPGTGHLAAAEGHLYATDLDLFGRGSLFELLCRARTEIGERTLAGWLLAPASCDEIDARQRAVVELAALGELRERIATLGAELGERPGSDGIAAWAARPAVLRRHRAPRAIAAALATANVTAALYWWPMGAGPAPLLALLTAQLLGFALLRRRLQRLTHGVERSARHLDDLCSLLRLLEGSEFTSSWLQARRSRLASRPEAEGGSVPGARATQRSRASQRIGELRRLVELHDAMRNPFFAPFGLLLLWGTQTGLALDGWRQEHGGNIADWLAALGEIEAAASLAAFAHENPTWPMPEILASDASVQLVARDLGHPLLGAGAACELNDVALGRPPAGEAQALVISGSNMSGKSTFLRACGSNLVLALAGAPVRASSMRCSRLAIGASIQVLDSLQEGASKFYAEITRLRRILDLCDGEAPVLFLLDEILHGTNSHDRRIGAEAVVRALLERGAIGLVTTHDLALARMAEDEQQSGSAGAAVLRNKHFVDTLGGGRITFDYRLREGVVQRSNALALMREVGLDV